MTDHEFLKMARIKQEDIPPAPPEPEPPVAHTFDDALAEGSVTVEYGMVAGRPVAVLSPQDFERLRTANAQLVAAAENWLKRARDAERWRDRMIWVAAVSLGLLLGRLARV